MSNLTFVHLTDLHIGEPGVPDDHLYADTTANLRAILADVKRMDPAPAFVVASGDLTNRGDAGSYRHLEAVIAEADLAMPVLFALGNHDKREGFYQTVLGRTEDLTVPYDHDHVIDGLHVIILDSSVPGKVGGSFELGQLEWLEERLEAHPELPKLLVMHHAPALDEDNPDMEWESLTIADTLALRDLVEDHDVIGILSGHIHFDRVSNWYGIPLVVGIGQHAGTDVLDMPRALRMVEAASFAIGTLRPSGLTISFVPQPATRRELHVIDMEQMRKYLAAAE